MRFHLFAVLGKALVLHLEKLHAVPISQSQAIKNGLRENLDNYWKGYNNMSLKVTMTIGSAIAALIASALWWRASVVLVRPQESKDRDGWDSAQIIVEHKTTGSYDPFLTNIKQSQMNKWAAMAASLAALLQGIALLIPE